MKVVELVDKAKELASNMNCHIELFIRYSEREDAYTIELLFETDDRDEELLRFKYVSENSERLTSKILKAINAF